MKLRTLQSLLRRNSRAQAGAVTAEPIVLKTHSEQLAHADWICAVAALDGVSVSTSPAGEDGDEIRLMVIGGGFNPFWYDEAAWPAVLRKRWPNLSDSQCAELGSLIVNKGYSSAAPQIEEQRVRSSWTYGWMADRDKDNFFNLN